MRRTKLHRQPVGEGMQGDHEDQLPVQMHWLRVCVTVCKFTVANNLLFSHML